MYRCSDLIEQIGKDVLLDLMYTKKPVFRLVEKDSLWCVQKCKVVAITNDKLIMSGFDKENVFTQGSDCSLVINGYIVSIDEQELTWCFEKEVAEFEAEMRNDFLEGENKDEI